MAVFSYKNILLYIGMLCLCGCSSVGSVDKAANTPEPTKNSLKQNIQVNQSLFKISGTGSVSRKILTQYLLSHNNNLSTKEAEYITNVYIKESEQEDINHDVAFIQMCHETNFLRFSGDVKKSQNNFCGLGATGNKEQGLSFQDVQTGVRAHIQHLQAYGSTEPLNNECIDPRFKFVQPKGKSPTIDGLTGTWAIDKEYHLKLRKKLIELKIFEHNNL